MVRATNVALPAYHGSLPAIAGDKVQALWQADWLGSHTAASNGLVIADWHPPLGLGVAPPPAGAAASAGVTVAAIRATTGALVWAVALPSSLPRFLGLVPAGKVVVVEAGRDVGRAPAAVFPVVTEFLGLDQATGRQLWAVPADSRYQDPAITFAGTAGGGLVVTGDASGTVTARWAATGAIAWQTPAGCPLLSDDLTPPVTVAADGSLIAESVDCDPSTVIRRLDSATGKPLWTWRTPTAAMAGNLVVSMGGVASDGGVVLVTHLGDPGRSETTWSAAGLPSPYPWPASPDGPQAPRPRDSFALALDAATGRPRWSQAGFPSYALSAGAACGVAGTGIAAAIQCRDDVTAAATMPDLVTPPQDNAEPPYVSSGLAVITSARASEADITLSVLAVCGGMVTTRVRLAVKPYTDSTGQKCAPQVAAVDVLPDGGYLVLVRRNDLPDSPILALRLEPAS